MYIYVTASRCNKQRTNLYDGSIQVTITLCLSPVFGSSEELYKQ